MPLRTCLVCRKENEKKELLRFVLVNGEVELDLQAVKPGRGAYLCNTKRCLEDRSGKIRIRGILELGSRATKTERKKLLRQKNFIAEGGSKLGTVGLMKTADLVKNR